MNTTTRFVGVVLLCTLPTSWGRAEDPATSLDRLAGRFVAESLKYDPTVAYETGLPTGTHDRFADNSLKAIAAREAEETEELHALDAIDVVKLPQASLPAYATLREQLESDLQLRVCHHELWNVDHFDGWVNWFAEVAEKQPVGAANLRSQALRRYGSVPRYVDVEIFNLRRGLEAGYAAPQSVVRRVIAQLKALTALPPEQSPYFIARRDAEPAFRVAFTRLIAIKVNPALDRYRDFLAREYLQKARPGVALSDLPQGEACYQAYLRHFTTLKRTPREVYELGMRTVEANKAEVIAIGRKLFGIEDYGQIIAKTKERVEDHVGSREELLEFSRKFLARAKSKTAMLIDPMPQQDCTVEPEPDFEDQAGVSSHYVPDPDPAKPGVFRIELGNWQNQTRGEAEVTVVHEAWPGHHLQISLSHQIVPDTPLNKISSNSAYEEGWARYAEALGEEAGIYETEDAKILRRVWPARGMVVDPGLHVFHWTREQAVDFLVASGRFDAKGAESVVDRIAVMPGQLTAYDSGGLEIKALRAEAQEALGERFDPREFNRTVLDEGVVPLVELRRHVRSWIESKHIQGRET